MNMLAEPNNYLSYLDNLNLWLSSYIIPSTKMKFSPFISMIQMRLYWLIKSYSWLMTKLNGGTGLLRVKLQDHLNGISLLPKVMLS